MQFILLAIACKGAKMKKIVLINDKSKMNRQQRQTAANKFDLQHPYYPIADLHKKRRIEFLPIAEEEHMIELKVIIKCAIQNLKCTMIQYTPQEVKLNGVDNKKDIFSYITFKLKYIIEEEYFGDPKNRGCFNAIVKRIISSSGCECILKTKLIEGYEIEKMLWLQNVKDIQEKYKILMEVNIWMFNLVKHFIRMIFQKVNHTKTHEFSLIRRNEYCSFKDQVKNNLIRYKHITYITKPDQSTAQRCRGELQFIPKSIKTGKLDSQCIRILVKNFGNVNMNLMNNKTYVKIINMKLKSMSKELSTTLTGPFYDDWKRYAEYVQNQKVYGIKIDIADAFGNINIALLQRVLDKYDIKGHLSVSDKKVIKEHITNPIVSIGRNKTEKRSNYYKWHHGLLQGDRLSSSLCQLYTSYHDHLHLKEFYQSKSFMHKTTDDFFYCSTDKGLVERFGETLGNIYLLNADKRETNLIDRSKKINYSGHIFDLDSMDISGKFILENETQIRHRFKIWNYKRPLMAPFVPNAIKQTMKFGYNSYHFNNEKCNMTYNTYPKFLSNFYEGMIYVSFKLEYVLSSMFYSEDSEKIESNMHLINQNIVEILLVYPRVILRRQLKMRKQDKKLGLDMPKLTKVLHILTFGAIITVLKKRSGKYASILKHLEVIYKSYSHKLPRKFDRIDYRGLLFRRPYIFRKIVFKRM